MLLQQTCWLPLQSKLQVKYRILQRRWERRLQQTWIHPTHRGASTTTSTLMQGQQGCSLTNGDADCKKPDSSTLLSHHSTQTTGMLTFSAVNGEILAEQWRLQSETTPRPPNYTIALPALLAGPKCYADAATEPDNIQHTHTHRNTGLVIFINNTQTQPVHHIYIYTGSYH